MFGLDFLFGSALLALPAAALPVVLHLLFRRKSPIVPFSTLRFIKLSIQHTAARKRVQRWLLLTCRVLLLALLIWAVAQPVKKLTSDWAGGGQGIAAAVVVDTSYSMELQEGPVSLLDKADSVVGELLRGPLAKAQVAIFRSAPGVGDGVEQLESAAKIQSQWAGLKPTASPGPLSDRVTAAISLLRRSESPQKWLVVISDLQNREFPTALPEFAGVRVVLFDLHPEEPRAATVRAVGVVPAQPLPGIGSEGYVEAVGRAGDSRFAGLSVTKVDGSVLLAKPAQRAAFESNGPVRLTFALQLPAERWMLLTGALQQDEPLPWAKTRSTLVETPPRQVVTFIDPPAVAGLVAPRFMRLALDPSEGKVNTWPLDLQPGANLTGTENAVVAPLTAWPTAAQAAKWRDFARGGGSVVLALRPGLEESWPKLADAQKDVLTQLLPSAPYASSVSSSPWRGGVANADDPLLTGLVGGQAGFEGISVRRFVPLAVANPADTSVILNMNQASAGPGSGEKSLGLLFRKRVGSGTVYTLATLPDPSITNLATHTRFLPMMVRMCLRPPGQAQGLNVELGGNLVLTGPQYVASDQLEVTGPKGEVYQVNARADAKGRRFEFDRTGEPGLYAWRKAGDKSVVAYTNVQLPAAEAELFYKDAKAVAVGGENTLVARSFAEFQNTMTKIAEPEPQWQWPIAIVLFLLCLEARWRVCRSE